MNNLQQIYNGGEKLPIVLVITVSSFCNSFYCLEISEFCIGNEYIHMTNTCVSQLAYNFMYLCINVVFPIDNFCNSHAL